MPDSGLTVAEYTQKKGLVSVKDVTTEEAEPIHGCVFINQSILAKSDKYYTIYDTCIGASRK